MLIAKDLMTIRPLTFSSNATLESTLLSIGDYKVTSVAVLGPDQKILGTLTEIVLLELYLKNRSKEAANKKLVNFKKHFLKADCVQESSSLERVMNRLRRSTTGRLWVVNSSGRLTGVISPKDVFQFLRGEERSAEPMFEELSRLKKDLKIISSQGARTAHRLERLENLINGNTYMLHSVDKNGIIVLANRRIHEVLGYSYGELVGMSLEDLYGQDLAILAKYSLFDISKGKEQSIVRTFFRKKTGHSIGVEIISAAVQDKKGNFVSTSSMSRLLERSSEHKRSA